MKTDRRDAEKLAQITVDKTSLSTVHFSTYPSQKGPTTREKMPESQQFRSRGRSISTPCSSTAYSQSPVLTIPLRFAFQSRQYGSLSFRKLRRSSEIRWSDATASAKPSKLRKVSAT